MLELSDQEFKTTIINMLTAPMDKVDSMKKKKMGNVSKEMGILREQQKDILGIKNTGTEIKNPWASLLAVWTKLRKEAWSLRVSQ